MKLVKKLFPIAAIFVLASCAKSTSEISAHYVSPLQYNDFSCKQISMEMQRVSRRTSELAGQVDKTASDDNAQMAVGLILFWPTLFFLDGDTPQAAEYARLKGEFDALEQSAIQKECDIKIERPVIKKSEPAKENTPSYPGSRHH